MEDKKNLDGVWRNPEGGKMNKIALTVDVDFFFRELFEWDFGYSEDDSVFASDVVWGYRYSAFDLLKESDVEKYADCIPSELFIKLLTRGFKFRDASIGAGHSHKFAYDFFKPFDFDVLINLDAHHDCFASDKKGSLHCGNWVLKLLQSKPEVLYHWVYPAFLKKTFGIKAPKEVSKKLSLKELLEENKNEAQVVAIYIAQSPVWTPPHFDPYFFQLIEMAKMFTGKTAIADYKFVLRKNYSEKVINELFEQGKKQKKEIEAFYKNQKEI